MSNVFKIFELAVSVIVLSALIGLLTVMFSQVKKTANVQKESLAEIQEEYEDRDVLLLSGETVSAAEAATVARKYRNKCVLYKNGALLDANVAGLRQTFSEGSSWVVEPTTNANGVCISINFKNPNGVVAEPDTVGAAKSDIANIVGGSSTDDWQSLMDKVSDLKSSELYRGYFATFYGLNPSSDWNTIYQKATDTGSAGTIKLSCEQKVLTVGESYNYTLDGVTFCYLTNGSNSGVINFSSVGVSYSGDFDSTDVAVDFANKTITNNSDNSISCTFDAQ